MSHSWPDLWLRLTLAAEPPSGAGLPSLRRPLSPAEATIAESDSDILLSRFRPEQRVRLAADLRREDDLLREYIDVGKLDFWFQELLASVESQGSSTLIAAPSNPESNIHQTSSVDTKARLTWV